MKTLAEVKKYAAKIPKMKPLDCCDDFLKQFNEMAVHTRKRKPKDLLLKRRPNEPKDVYEYRLCNYEPITYGSMNKAFDNLNRIFNGVNYKLHVDEETQQYMNKKKFKKNTFKMFFTKIFLKRMIEDPNGFLLWLPGGQGLVDNTKTIEPYPVLVFSYNLIDFSDDYAVFLSDEKSMVPQGDQFARTGKVYYIITKTAFYKHSQAKGSQFNLEEIYVHNLGELPIVPLGGDLNADGFYESFFAPYVAFGNEAIRAFSDWQALSTTAAHPIREEFFTQCDMVPVSADKKNKDQKDGEENMSYSRTVELKPLQLGPFGTIKRPIGETADDGMGEQYLPYEIPSVRWISPGIEFVKNAYESFTGLLDKAEDALHLNLGELNQSGVAKEIDLLSHQDMLQKIFNQMLDDMQASARIIVAYLEVKPFDDTIVKLTTPASYRVKTEVELTEELGKLKTSNAPAMLQAAVARELSALRFSGDELNQKIFTVIACYDPLFIYSLGEKQSLVMANMVTKDDAVKSFNFYVILLNISYEMGEAAFIEESNEKLYNRFLEAVKPYLLPEPKTLTDDLGNPV